MGTTMIELTEQQVRSLETPAAIPPRLINPKTKQRFVLLPEEEYERLSRYDADSWTDEERDLLRAEAVEALGWEDMEAYQVEITSNLTRRTDPANLLIEVATPEGRATGLAQDSVITCLQLATISEDRTTAVIGKLSVATLAKLNECLKAVLDIP